MRQPSRSIRFGVAVLILLLAAGAIAGVWLARDEDRQANFLLSFALGGAGIILCGLWLLAFGGLSWKGRCAVLGAVGLLGALLALTVRFRGVTGDLVPILAWRRGGAAASRGGASVVKSVGRLPEIDHPEFLGEGRDAVLPHIRLERDWAALPPRLLWRRQVGSAWSGFAVAGDAAFTQEQDGDHELVTCRDLFSGERRWTHSYPARYQTGIGGLGPRATPTVHGARVYTLGATGILCSLDRGTGAVSWQRDVVAENGGKVNEWGMSGSPLLTGNLVIVSTGGRDGRALAAYDHQSGAPVWQGGDDRCGYSSPLLAVLAGTPQILLFNRASVAAHDPASGAVLWQVPWPSGQPNVAQPLPLPSDRVLIAKGYGVGATLFQVEKLADGKLAARELWKSRALKSKFAAFVHQQGFVYGLDDGILTCIDAATGERAWKSGRYGHGQLMLAGDLLLVSAEDGAIVLVEPSPRAHVEAARFQALEGKMWNPPALAPPYLVVRTEEEAACYEIRLAAGVKQSLDR
jgi:outer membrane protein assembly factor BamB